MLERLEVGNNRRALAIALAAAVAAIAAAAPLASAHGTPPKAYGEAKLRALETETLGSEHATDHTIARRAVRIAKARLSRMSPTQRRSALRRDRRATARLAAAVAPGDGGQWDTPFQLPIQGVHQALLPTGKIMFWSYPFPEVDGGPRKDESNAWLWDPADGSFEQVNPPMVDGKPARIFCSGGSLLGDGRLLTTGGNLHWPTGSQKWAGLDQVYTFNPWNETWTRQPDMRHGRWYPSQELLPDGRTVILSGWDENYQDGSEDTNLELEVFTPSANPEGVGTVTHHPSGDRSPSSSLYPHLFTTPNGKLLMAGPTSNEYGVLDPATMTWGSSPKPEWRRSSSALLLPGGPNGSTEVTQIGGIDPWVTQYDADDTAHTDPRVMPRDTTSTLDLTSFSSWQTDAAKMNVARSNHNTVQLPDGSIVAIGGSYGENKSEGKYATPDAASGHPDTRQAEIWDPVTRQWRLGPPQAEYRAYHSTAVLLPDGRVLSAGDDRLGQHTWDTGEVYSPPYLFKGTRPTIASAPSGVAWDAPFRIASPSGGISRAVLMAPGVTTHGEEMHAKHVELRIASHEDGSGLTAISPPTSAVAQPGWYMLFILDDQGVPSVAKWIRLFADADNDGDGKRDAVDGCPAIPANTANGCPPAVEPREPGNTGGDDPGAGGDGGGPKNLATFGAETNVKVIVPRGGVRISRRSTVSIKLSNANPFPVASSGSLRTAGPVASRAHVLKLGSAAVTLPSRRSATLKLKLARKTMRTLRRRASTRVVLTLTVRDPRGTRRTVRKTFTLRRPAGR